MAVMINGEMIEAGTLHTASNFGDSELSEQRISQAGKTFSGVHKCQGTSSLVPEVLKTDLGFSP
jgi:hypothetical protein